MAQSIDAKEFQKRVLEGKNHSREIVLSAEDGAELEGVEMHVVSKKDLTKAIESMPDSVFTAVEDEDDDLSAEEAEELAKEAGGATVTEGMYEAFEMLCKESLQHPDLSPVQFETILEEFAFEVVFEIGSEVLSFSLENSGTITGFRELN